MLLIPAIDLKDGKCVRLKQGRMEDVTVFSDDPVAMAVHWKDAGCRRLHLVDLDGAFAGEPKNRDVIQAITRAMGDVPVQVGGGIRDQATIAGYLDAGISQVIVGTKAIEEPAFLEAAAAEFPGKLILGLDARDGMLAVAGWDETSTVEAVAFARDTSSLPLAGIVYTDIARDGMMQGVNIEATRQLAEAVDIPIIASGGVTNMTDLKELQKISRYGVSGVITGRAIYEGTLDFAEGQNYLDQAS